MQQTMETQQGLRCMPPPRFPQPKFSTTSVEHQDGVGTLLVSQTSGRRFFCPEHAPCVHTQFSGSVSRCFEAWVVESGFDAESSIAEGEHDEQEHDLQESNIICFQECILRYYPSRPMALKTCRIDSLLLEACYQQCELGELTGEDPIKEVAALQLLQSHPYVEELEEAMMDETNIYKITPWYSGGELFDLAPLPEDSAKVIFAQLLDALEFVHSRGVCHRDISLENILMDTRAHDRRSACRSSSCSSIQSCISMASSISNESRMNAIDGSASGCDDVAEFAPLLGQPSDIEDGDQYLGRIPRIADQDEDNDINAPGHSRGKWIGRPRLCDFGMSLLIPKSRTGKKLLVTPQGRCGKNTCVAPEVFHDQVFDANAVDKWSLGTTLFMALLGVQPWEEVGDSKFQAIAEGKNLKMVLEGWNLQDKLSRNAVDLLQALLTADPAERLSDTKTILSHPWFRS